MGDLVSMAGWYFLPNLVAGWTQSAYYAVWIRAGDPKPQPGSRQYVAHRRRIYIIVVFSYLLYTIYEADHVIRQAGDFYRILGAPLDVDEKGLNSRFRRLHFHPDKIASNSDRQLADAFFIHLKQSRDALVDPVKRFAYDRLGPTVLEWKDCSTVQDFIMRGVRDTTAHYLGTAGVLAILGLVGYLRTASFWRYMAIGAMYTFEVYVLTRPETLDLLSKAINPFVTTFTAHPPYLQFQLLALMRKLLLSFFIALSQVGPMLFPAQASAGRDAAPEHLARLEQLARGAEAEAERLTRLELTPFRGDAAAMNDLRTAMRRWLVDNTVRSAPQVRDAMGRVIPGRGGAGG